MIAAHERVGLGLRWDPERRLLFVQYRPGFQAGRQEAEEVQRLLDVWTSGIHRFGIVADLTLVDELPPTWRAAWAGWFAERKTRVRVAVHGAHGQEKTTIPVFALMTGVDVRTFPDAASALQWAAPEPSPAPRRKDS